MHAVGTFEVQVKPVEPVAGEQGTGTGRMLLSKQWFGEITGTSSGEMLTSMTKATGAMAYVALEQMDVSIAGHHGTFVLQHSASMQAGADPRNGVLKIEVVPNSGTGALAGITGSLTIEIVEKVHRYDLAYSLPAAP